MRKVHFLSKGGFQVIAFFIVLKVGYLTLIVNFAYKWARQLFVGHHKMFDSFIVSKYFSDSWFNFIKVTWFTIFQSKIPKQLLSNSKAVSTWEGKKMWQIVPVLKQCLEKLDIKL